MGKLKAFYQYMVIQFLGLLAFSILIWLAGPLIVIAGHVPWRRSCPGFADRGFMVVW